MQSNTKKTIPEEEWRRRLEEVEIKKSDLNRLVMDFLVTEVSSYLGYGYIDTVLKRITAAFSLQSSFLPCFFTSMSNPDPPSYPSLSLLLHCRATSTQLVPSPKNLAPQQLPI